MGNGLIGEPGLGKSVTGFVGRVEAKACEVCGHLYVPHRQAQAYCSPRCYQKAYNAAHPVARAAQRALPGESRVERAFAAWIASEDGRVVEAEVIRRAMLLRARGYKHWGIASLWESIRYDYTLALQGEAGAWRLNNSYRSLLARRIMAACPDLAGFFETRPLRGRVA